MKRIVLLNVYGSKNIGDEAINIVATQLLVSCIRNTGIITALAVEKRLSKDLTKLIKFESVVTPYGIAIDQGKEKISSIRKIVNFLEVVTVSFFITFLPFVKVGKNSKYEYINKIRESDLVVNMGGGYLRTKNSVTDTFGLLLTILPICISKIFNKSNVFLPMSFGNFANSFHKRLSLYTISNSIFYARDEISMGEIQNSINFKNYKIDLRYSPDLALFFSNKTQTKKRSQYIVLSAREWLEPIHQKIYENNLAILIQKIYKKYKLKTFFISMAANSIEDDDRLVGKRLEKIINNPNIFTLSSAKDPYEVVSLLEDATAGICTRMHSAILSSLTATPFITIQYEHKTLGFMKSLGFEHFNIEIDKTNENNIFEKFEELMKKDTYDSIQEKLLLKKREYKKYHKKIQYDLQEILNNE